MNLNIKTTNISLTDAMQSYLEKKLMSLDKLVDFSRDNVMVRAELAKTSHHHKSGDIFKAMVTIMVGGHTYMATSEKDDLYAAIDDVKDELAREIKSGKEKHTDLIRKGAQKIKTALHEGAKEEGIVSPYEAEIDAEDK